MAVEDRRHSAGDCPSFECVSTPEDLKKRIIVNNDGRGQFLVVDSLSLNSLFGAGNSNSKKAGNGFSNVGSQQRSNSLGVIRQGVLRIKENSNPSSKQIKYVEGKGKAIAISERSETPNFLKTTGSSADVNVFSSGMKIFVNRFVNWNAIPGPSHSVINENSLNYVMEEDKMAKTKGLGINDFLGRPDVVNSSRNDIIIEKKGTLDPKDHIKEHMNQGLIEKSKIINSVPCPGISDISIGKGCLRTQVDPKGLFANSSIPYHNSVFLNQNSIPELEDMAYNSSVGANQVEIRNDGDATLNLIGELSNGIQAVILSVNRIPEGNSDVDSTHIAFVDPNNKFNRLSDLAENGCGLKSQMEFLEEDREEGAVTMEKGGCLDKNVSTVIQEVNSESLQKAFNTVNCGKSSSHKTKLAKEIRHLGPLNSTSRHTRIGANKAKGFSGILCAGLDRVGKSLSAHKLLRKPLWRYFRRIAGAKTDGSRRHFDR
ncbi:hypothetical protein MA16_Dca003053 [Dendrobium catenatum]|uniref:Uncharacterized protein n=1 Tax=Dendrobium catenatum TaxID=906689 RepID=A0A2I0XBQ2_9ASPA|nr:hypothetical protein MA16_Dca003053 [Dendrobium catenatum]